MFTFTVQSGESPPFSVRTIWRELPHLLALNDLDPNTVRVVGVEGVALGGCRLGYRPLTDRLVASGPIAGNLLKFLRSAGFRSAAGDRVLSAGYTLLLADCLETALGAGDIPCVEPEPVAPQVVWHSLRLAEGAIEGTRRELAETTGPKVPYLLRELAHGMDRIKLIKSQYGVELAQFDRLRVGHRIPLVDGRTGIALRVNEQSVNLMVDGSQVSVPYDKINMFAYRPD